MKNKKFLRFVLALILTGIMLFTASCSSFPFKDVSADAKYYDDIAVVYDLGLMMGKNKNSFLPEGTLSYGEVVAIAAKLHILKNDAEPVEEQGDVWYQAYVDYCKVNNIIVKEYNWNDSASRAESIDILSRAVQTSDLNEKNYVAEGSIPDVSESSEYYNSIYKFYKAGIFQGIDESFNCDPDGFILRYEVAGMLNRIMNPSERYSFVLLSDDEDTKVDDGEVQYDDIIIMRTPIGDFYYPGKWIGMVSSQTVTVSNGYIAEVYGKINNTSLLLATFYIGTEQDDGMLLGYVNDSDIRVNIENPDLSGWTEEDRVTVYGMKEDINYILKQIMAHPGYERTVDKEEDSSNHGNQNTGNTDNTKPNQGNTDTGNTDNSKPNQGNTDTGNTDNTKPNQGNTDAGNTDNTKPNQGNTDAGNTDNSKPNQGNTGTENPDNTKPNQGNTGTENPDNTKPNQGNTGTGNTDNTKPNQGNTDNNNPNQGDNVNSDAPDFILLETPVGTLYFPGRWTGKVVATPVASNQGDTYDIYCKTNSGAAKLYTIYIYSGRIDGFLVGYIGNIDIRIEIVNAALTGWSTADKEVYSSMQDTVNNIVEQFMRMPGYTDFISNPGNSGSTDNSDNNNNNPDWMPDYDESLDSYLPWENGGKQPPEYTWAEFEALTPGQQMKFQSYFESSDLFEAWRQNAQGEPPEEEIYLPWENGGKQPSAYTWAEYEALNPGQQMKFQDSFGSAELFDEWRQSVQGSDPGSDVYLPWENGGKQPSDYTWAEFEALNEGQQMAFQDSFGSFELFDAWMQRAQGSDPGNDVYLPWENGGKQPSEYTWAEFEALNEGQQMAFQNSFGSFELFEAWMQRAQQ